jgi:hypothetical protein
MNNNYNNLDKDEEAELLTSLANFINSPSGKYLIEMINITRTDKVEELIYANKDELLNLQGELKAYSNILTFLNPEAIRSKREQLYEED